MVAFAVMVTIAGLLVLAGAMTAAALLVQRRRPPREWASAGAVGLAAGAALVLADRFVFAEPAAAGASPDGAALRAAVERATAEADRIEELRHKLEGTPMPARPAPTPAPARASLDPNRAGEDASRKLREVDQALDAANASLLSLREVTELLQLLVAAHGDDRGAFDRLDRLSRDASYRYRDTAAGVRRAIALEHSKEILIDDTRVSWRPGVDPRRVVAAELKSAFQGLPAEHRPAFLDFVSQRRDLSRRQRMAFFADVLRKDPSLHVVECAGRYFAHEAGLDPRPLAVGFYLDWWASNEASVKD